MLAISSFNKRVDNYLKQYPNPDRFMALCALVTLVAAALFGVGSLCPMIPYFGLLTNNLLRTVSLAVCTVACLDVLVMLRKRHIEKLFINAYGYYYYGDFIRAVRLFEQVSDLGDLDATYLLARCYQNGEGVPMNKQKAAHLYQKASDLGHFDATCDLAFCYQRGEGVPMNKTEAVRLFEKTSDLGNLDGTYYLACCYREGEGVLQDKENAFRIFKKISDSHIYAAYALFRCYEYGEGVPMDKQEAARIRKTLPI